MVNDDLYEEQHVPQGTITSISFNVLTHEDAAKISVLSIENPIEVTDPKLGVPNLSSQCSTCGAKDIKNCEGHFGVIKFPYTILHPYYVKEVVSILNKVCPGCKTIRKSVRGPGSKYQQEPKGCRYCKGDAAVWYPKMKFKLSSSELFKKTTIMVDVSDSIPKKFQNRNVKPVIPADYWDFIPKDVQQEEHNMASYRRVLSHAQVHHLLLGVDPSFVEQFVPKRDALFMNSVLVTPNNHRLTEVIHPVSTGQTIMFDEHTKDYKKMAGPTFRGTANDLGSHVLDCLKKSKLTSDKSSKTAITGLKWIKEVVLAKRNDHSFRMVVVGDPNIKLNEVGIPRRVAERLQIAEQLNSWNWGSLKECCSLRIFEKGEIHVRRKGNLVKINRLERLEMGDTVYRPVQDGDVVLVNRPPSIHQHSLIAKSVKILPVNSVMSINPLCCSPFRGDFDGDCLHGYLPQSFESRVELTELVALDKQLINRQSGRNLLALSQDSLSALYLILDDQVVLDRFQVQQLEMFSSRKAAAPSCEGSRWTGKQVFSMLLPPDFEYEFPADGVRISKGNLVSSVDSSGWIRDSDENLFNCLVKHSPSSTLEFLYAAQEVLCGWLSLRGLSVSLADLCISVDGYSRSNLLDEVQCGLREAEEMCRFKQLLVDSSKSFLAGNIESLEEKSSGCDAFSEGQKSTMLCQTSVNAFNQVFRDVQSLAYQYVAKDNTLMAMFKAGSKGNMSKLVQQGMCLGLQNSLIPLSFKFPSKLSCNGWNHLKSTTNGQDTSNSEEAYIPYAIVESSYVSGLNPFECFVHSVVSRESSFGDNAELPGSLHRKIMFFMRDLYVAYDGTVRSAHGNQIIQFSHKSGKCNTEVVGGEPVGSLAACALSEAAYSALDQPVSLLEKSPLLNLKNILEAGLPKSSSDQTASLYLSKNLARQRHGFEYGSLEVKNHLEKILFSDIVSSSVIMFSPHTTSRINFSPWVCQFNLTKDILKRKRLSLRKVIDALQKMFDTTRIESKISLPNVQITSTDGSSITVSFECSKHSHILIEDIRDIVIPVLLRTVIKGFNGIKNVEIIWKDGPGDRKYYAPSPGELYLKITVSGNSRKKFWNTMVNNCIPIMDLIDWDRSHPDNIQVTSSFYGIDSSFELFLTKLQSAVSDVGKSILPEHLLLVASCLSSTGEFVGLNAKGLSKQKDQSNAKSPFVQACFSTPRDCFIKAAKAGVTDNLQGSLEALAWGNSPPIGTGSQFDIIYSGKGHELSKPVDIYSMLGSQASVHRTSRKVETYDQTKRVLGKLDGESLFAFKDLPIKGSKDLNGLSKTLQKFISREDVLDLAKRLSYILHKNPMNYKLNEEEKSILMVALRFHPGEEEKVGSGVHEIKVGKNPKFEESRCFLVVRTDGSIADFSYHKCIVGALEVIAPSRVEEYKKRRSEGNEEESSGKNVTGARGGMKKSAPGWRGGNVTAAN